MSRKSRESIVIGGATGFDRLLKVTVIDTDGETVRLGIEVADDVPVGQLELWRKICSGLAPPSAANAIA
jgi:sRNA-binding carbon storage regulator CsrA